MRDFLKWLFLTGTQGHVYVCSLANDKGQKDGPTERHILTRDLDHIEEFTAKWDQAGRGLYWCVSTLKPRSRRIKNNALEACFAYCDIDLKSIKLTLAEVRTVLAECPFPPSAIVFSGNGLHAYWRFEAPHEASEVTEDLNRAIADILAGDTQVAQRVALMRVPGSHNTKNGKWTLVEVLEKNDRLYTVAELAKLVIESPVLIERKDKPAQATGEDKNPFLQYAEEYSFKPPIDPEQRLAQMQYQGPGDTAIHATQVAVTASMLSAGTALEEVVETVLTATKAVAPEGWDWVAEEKTIRDMCKTWMRKLQKKEERVSYVVNLIERRIKRVEDGDEEKEEETKADKPKKNIVHQVLGNGFIATLRKRGDDILICREEVWRCEKGLWRSLPPGEAKGWLDRELEEGCRTLGIVSTQKVINEARAWILRNPEIYMAEVPWDEHGKIACKSGLLDPETFEIEARRDRQ